MLSALDSNTADAIFHRLIGSGGLLQRLGTTVIMTTHSGNTLILPTIVLLLTLEQAKYVDSADQVLLIGEDCTIESVSRSRDVVHGEKDMARLLSATSQDESIEKTKVTDSSQDTSKDDCLSSDEKPLVRQRGDFGLYVYYLNSTAKWLWAIWVVAVALCAFSERLPGKENANMDIRQVY